MAAAATATVAPITTACSRAQGTKPVRRTGKAPVTYLTVFGFTPRELYGAVALKQGFFDAAGLGVTIQPGKPGQANINTMVAGRAHFVGIDCASAIRNYLPSGGSYRAICAVQNQTLLSVMSLDGDGVTQPVDLVGKTIATGQGAATQTLFPAYARLARIDASKVHITQVADTTQLNPMLAAHKVSGIGTYLIDTPSVEKVSGKKPVVLPYSKYLTDLYGTLIITPKQLAARNPDVVRRFAHALMQGVSFAVQNPSQAAADMRAFLKDHGTTVDLDVATQTMALMEPYVGTGAIDETRMMQCIALMETTGVPPIGSGLTPDALVDFDMMATV
ncbi:ABC transporter substrate-binding protein [Rugosimonospora africana]|nr:ABC transporter substrate-binding protein [Rugosimonospora africana]